MYFPMKILSGPKFRGFIFLFPEKYLRLIIKTPLFFEPTHLTPGGRSTSLYFIGVSTLILIGNIDKSSFIFPTRRTFAIIVADNPPGEVWLGKSLTLSREKRLAFSWIYGMARSCNISGCFICISSTTTTRSATNH